MQGTSPDGAFAAQALATPRGVAYNLFAEHGQEDEEEDEQERVTSNQCPVNGERRTATDEHEGDGEHEQEDESVERRA